MIHHHLRDIREHANLTVPELADLLDIKPVTIYAIENGNFSANRHIPNLAIIYGCDESDLYALNVNKSYDSNQITVAEIAKKHIMSLTYTNNVK